MTTVTNGGLPAAAQHRHWGVSVEQLGDQVLVQMGAEASHLTPGQAKALATQVMRCYFRAELVELARQAKR